ncbi:MAG: UDP-3-O-(3-hydroxymyristoyl)glucosamine N-acyltransferase [Nevskiales bacterium]
MGQAFTLEELAARFGLGLQGDSKVAIESVCTLQPGRPAALAFVASSNYLKQLDTTQASAVVLTQDNLGDWPGNALISANPHADFARIAQLFDPAERVLNSGVHAAACIDPAARVHPSCEIAASVVIGAGSEVGANCYIGPGCVIGENVEIGEGSRFVANVSIGDRSVIGQRAHFQPGVVVGGRGFGLAPTADGWLEIPQLGRVRIGNDVELGANSCVDRGAIDDTIIEDGVKIDNLVQVGHNTYIGAHTAIAGCVGIAGSCRIGRNCQIGGAAGILGHLSIADNVVISAKSLVSSSINEPGLYSSSLPVQPAAKWRRQLARLRKLDDLVKRIKKLENDS